MKGRLVEDRLFAPAVAILLALFAARLLPTGSAATNAACAAILVFGLPHGSLDIETIKRQGAADPARVPWVLLLYVGLAAATYILWRVHPVAALGAFVVIAVVHFAEDWDAVGSPFLAQGMAAALLCAPSFGHIEDMASLFVALTGAPEAATLAEIMRLVAPVAMAVAAVALVALRQRGEHALALAGAAALAGMTFLPPAIGFAAFFCLFHSPRHFRAAVSGLADLDPGRRRLIAAALTLAALGIAALLFASEMRGDASARLVASSFMTLSILTVPHMAVPVIMAFLDARRARSTPQEIPHADQGPARI